MQAARWVLRFGSALLVAAAACSRDEPPSVTKDPSPPPQAATAQKVEITPVSGDAEDVASIVRRELERAHADHRDLIVYVGAPWCEPCTRFHQAALAGELDNLFSGLRVLEFDHDRDVDRLERAGYSSRLIPLFAVPSADGRASGKQIEGSIKGDGAVAQIAPRLKALLAERR